jgi:hypothetical protein
MIGISRCTSVTQLRPISARTPCGVMAAAKRGKTASQSNQWRLSPAVIRA